MKRFLLFSSLILLMNPSHLFSMGISNQGPIDVYPPQIEELLHVKRFPQNSPCFTPRSQSRDKARQLSGMQEHMHLLVPVGGCDPWWGNFTVIPSYTRSFRPEQIAQCIFGSDILSCNGCNQIVIQGSQVENRDNRAWLADYFYLPTDFKGSFVVEPRISNALIDLFLYLNMDEWLCGLYFTLSGPVVWSNWDLNYCETIDNNGTNSYVAGYFNPSGIPRENLLPNFSSFITGRQTLAPIDGIDFAPLQFTRFDCDSRKRLGFADLRFEFGWNFHVKDDNCSRFGVYLAGAAPTGNKKRSTFLFDPIIGNGNHWELGMGFSSHHIFWEDECRSKHLGLYFDACITHLFGARELRTFDLCNKPNSRYMLAAKINQNQSISGALTTPVEFDLAGRVTPGTGPVATAPSVQFKNTFMPVANLTSFDIKVQIAAQADVIILWNYTTCGWSFDLGYNLWARTREKFGCPTDCTTIDCAPSLCDPSQQNTWVLKGDSRAFGFVSNPGGAGNLNQNQAVPLSFSQEKANIHQGVNSRTTDPNDPIFTRNAGIDHPRFAVAGTNQQARLGFAPNVANVDENQIRTSIDPVFLTCSDVEFVSTRGDTHKIFANIMYLPNLDRDRWDWFFGVGGFGEFAHNHCPGNNDCEVDKSPYDRSINCALSQWGVWFKIGLSFYSADEPFVGN